MHLQEKEEDCLVSFQSRRRRAGFTLIETLIVATLGIILAGAIFIGLTSQNANQDLDLAATSLVSSLRNAQERSRGQEASTSWGIYLDNPAGARDYYALFSGSSFISATSTVYLPLTVEFSDPASGANKEIVFSKLTGLPTAAATVILRLVSDSLTSRTITVNSNGSVSY